MAVHMVKVPGMGTLAVDKYWRLYYDPKVCTEWDVPGLSTVLYHEVMHLLSAHCARAEAMNAEPRRWNFAADIAVNQKLRQEERFFPKGTQPLFPELYGLPENLLTEDYYDRLPVDYQLGGQGSGGQSGDGSGQPGTGGGRGSSPRPSSTGDPSPSGNGTGNGKNDAGATENQGGAGRQTPAPTEGNCGSGAGGEAGWWELDPPTADGSIPGIKETEGELIRRQVAHAIEEHCRSRGSVPGHLERWAGTKLVPKQNWKHVLGSEIRRAISDRAGMKNYSFRRPSRRQSALPDIVLPCLREPIVKVAVIIDTSGSISARMIDMCLGHVTKIIKATGMQDGVSVLCCDSRVHSAKQVFRAEQIQLFGGGGTDMQRGVDAAAKLKPRPDVIIVLTDGFTGWGNSAPAGSRVIVALLDRQGSCPSWARRILVEEN